MSTIKPFIKWAGGKGQILHEIRAKYPAGLGKNINKYAEPFVGGGAVLFDILNTYNITEAYISDVNRELIGTYIAVRDNVAELISALETMETAYLPADAESRKKQYYAARERFNELKAAQSNNVELAALMIFLNRTCFNGLYRVNGKGAFNVPQGSYKNPKICDADNLEAVSEKLKSVEIVCGDYMLSSNFVDDKTFAYFDPPYRPLNATSSFTSYTQDGFDDIQQEKLAHFVDKLTARGVRILVSNSDPKNTNENDDFFDTLYSKHEITRISASRAINSVSSGRGRISELLIVNAVGGFSMRDFNNWLSHFRESISDYGYYVDFDKVHKNVDSIKIELNILNSLVGSSNIEAEFDAIVAEYPKTLKCIPILLAVRECEIFAVDDDGEFKYRFDTPNYSPEQYREFMRKTGLFDLMENHIIRSLVDYVTGVETGLDSNGRKNRGGHLMENLVESYLMKSGFERDVTYFKEMKLGSVEKKWGIDLSALSNQGKTVKRFDFIVKPADTIYAIETNFYTGQGSKLNETARSYKNIALEAKDIDGFAFVWFTDGKGWRSARNNLEETFDVMEHIYSIADLEDGIMQRIFV